MLLVEYKEMMISLMIQVVSLLYKTVEESLQERPHHGGPDVVVGEEESQHDVVHRAVVGAGQALPEEVHSLLVFRLGGVIPDQRPPEGDQGSQGVVHGRRNATGTIWSCAGVSVALHPHSVSLDGVKVVGESPHKLVQGLRDGFLSLLVRIHTMTWSWL